MAAVILGWDAKHWDRWNYRSVVEHVRDTGRYLDRWDLGPGRDVRPDTEVWLLFQGSHSSRSGLLGHGTVVSASPSVAAGEVPASTPGRYAGIVFDAVLPLGEQIPVDTLAQAVPDIRWSPAPANGVLPVPSRAEPGLRNLWREHGPATLGPAELVPGTCPPGAVAHVTVNRFERDPDARRACLAFHGTACAACGFSFETAYGEAGTGAIQVHHAVPAQHLRDGYELDPVADLVPLCANCHAMAHHGVPTPRTVRELRAMLSEAGHLHGEVVTDHELEAQENARRILEGHN